MVNLNSIEALSNSISISVIIPNFNRSELLKKAITSILNQSYSVLEILVCDDGSTDNSKEIVEQFNLQMIKWVDCGKNGRPAIPRNIGIKKAKGNYVAFLDNDDEWLPTKIEEQVKLIIEKKALIICTNAYKVSAVNCEKYNEVCQYYDIQSYPTVKLYRNGQGKVSMN